MQVLRIETGSPRSKKRKVVLDTGESFCLYGSEMRRFQVVEGDLPEETYEEILWQVLYPRARKRAYHLISRRDYTYHALEEKLIQGGYPAPARDKVLSELTELSYINDQEYAASYIRMYQSAKSKQQMMQGLLRKGISKDVIQKALEEEYAGDEGELILSLLRKKGYCAETSDEKQRAKMYRYLRYRGFYYEQFSKYL